MQQNHVLINTLVQDVTVKDGFLFMNQDDFYILLDWDNITYHEMIQRIEYWFKINTAIKEIEVRASSSLNGYHIYIKTFNYINPNMIFRLRFDWDDDYKKLCMDMLNKTARHRGDLFSKKIIIRNGTKYEFKEIKMFKYYRNNPNSEWKNESYEVTQENNQKKSQKEKMNLTL